MGNEQTAPHSVSFREAGVPRRAYVQLMLLGAMIPAELATMMKWSAPAGALLLGGTVAAGVSSELAPRAWARIRGIGSTLDAERDSHEGGNVTLRFSTDASGSDQGAVSRDLVEAALRRVSRRGDLVLTRASGDFLIELRAWTSADAAAVGRRMVMAVENRLNIDLAVHVERDNPAAERSPAASTESSAPRQAPTEVVDGYSLRRNILHGEPATASLGGGQLFRRARERLQALAPVAA